MNILFSILSIVYISAIFILAGSPIVRILAPFNPYSLLHIPLYGILTFLLIFSLIPMTPLRSHSIDLPREMRSLFHRGELPNNSIARFLVVGVIALGVGIADEIHQAYVPGRDASVTDVLLDMVGIILVLFFVLLFHKKQKSLKSQSTQ
jgi:hypothetical protein